MRDAKLLEKELKKNPNHPRNQFYLAQSYRDAGKTSQAAKHYKKRIKMGGFIEEVYVSHLWASRCTSLAENRFDWEGLMNAHIYRPTRIEAVYDMVRYCRVSKLHWVGYAICKEALTIRFPKEDVLFIEHEIWDWRLDDEFSLCAHNIGRHVEAIKACERALTCTAIPPQDRARIIDNEMKIRNVAKGTQDKG